MEGKPIIYIAMVDIRMILKYYTLTSILLLVFIWLFDIGVTAYIYNNHKFFLIFIFFIKKIMGAVAIFYKKGNIFII